MNLEAVDYIARDDSFWHWAILQNAAGIEIVAGDPRRAARLLGFIDRRYASFPDGQQPTEEIQRARIMEQLAAALPQPELAKLLKEGQQLSAFEADHLAGFPTQVLDRAVSRHSGPRRQPDQFAGA